MEHSTSDERFGTYVPGYDYGSPRAAHSPLSAEELRQLEQTIGWSNEDAQVLRRYSHLFQQHAEAMVDSWRAVISSQPHLVKWFFGPDGTRDAEYASKVKPRFVRWVIDAATLCEAVKAGEVTLV